MRAVADAAVEAIWSTRCIICDKPGALLCPTCRLYLPYIDRWLACPRCGAPHGRLQCVDCNTYSLSEVGRSAPPFIQCVSAIEHRGAARAIVTGFKDAGERRLAKTIADVMAACIPRAWLLPDTAIVHVPADRRARMRRGFDHMDLISKELADILGLPRARLVEKRPVADQRGLGRAQRFENMADAVQPSRIGTSPPACVILVDDVCTTGATLFAASDALLACGVREVRCATFARVS